MGSGCYVYAIVRRDTPLPTADARAARLVMVPWRSLAAVTGPLEDDEAAAPLTMEAVLRHEAVVEAVRRHGPALPVRFGTVFRDATSVASAVAAQYEPLSADLDRLGDKVELSLTALWARPASDDGALVAAVTDAAQAAVAGNEAVQVAAVGTGAGQGAGGRYIRARAAELRRGEALKERARAVSRDLDQVLGWLALERRVSLLPTPGVAVRTVYLLDPGAVNSFRVAFGAIRGQRRELRVLLTGPWPPYSFVKRTEAGTGSGRGRPV